jgi:hypothetical protein
MMLMIPQKYVNFVYECKFFVTMMRLLQDNATKLVVTHKDDDRTFHGIISNADCLNSTKMYYLRFKI